MNAPEQTQLLHLLRSMAAASFFEDLAGRAKFRFRQGIYTPGVVVWLMIWQRLHPKGTLSAAIETLAANTCWPVLRPCKRVRQSRISSATGGYCQARLKLPKVMVMEVTDHLVNRLQKEIQEGWPGLQRPVFLIDGSSLQLKHAHELVRAFPPAPNQHGNSHWPVLKIVVLHDVFSGLAVRPSWGPMFGPQAVSEQALACSALERLPPHAVVLADRNFGIFSVAYAVEQSKRGMVFRLTQARANKIASGVLQAGIDQKVLWTESRWDQLRHPERSGKAQIEGRLLVYPHPSQPTELLFLFTTLSLPSEQVLALYKLRWNVETDLRSLKQTVRLHQLSSKSVDMVEKELLLAISAYNLVRAVMCLAARREPISPRQLSFSRVQDAVYAFLPHLTAAASEQESTQLLQLLLLRTARCRLPNRSRPRSFPRLVWGRGASFPSRKTK
jgi:hypothetical protein